jgi:hypothetical protein
VSATGSRRLRQVRRLSTTSPGHRYGEDRAAGASPSSAGTASDLRSEYPSSIDPERAGAAGGRDFWHILFAKYGLHLPLNRQSTVYVRERIVDEENESPLTISN